MNRKGKIIATVILTTGLFLTSQGLAENKPTTSKSCSLPGCHRPAEKVLRGTVSGISWNARTIQINTGSPWLVKFGEDTKLTGAEKWSRIPREKEIAITTIEKNGELYAASVSVKPPVKVSTEKLITVDEMARLAAIGPEKGNFILIDSRPEAKYNEGHIPGAISIFEAALEKNLPKLPKEKLLVFYCAGPT